jgi:hypothetical protein
VLPTVKYWPRLLHTSSHFEEINAGEFPA